MSNITKEYSKIVVLENDIEHQGLPDSMQDILQETAPEIEKEIWWWFGEDVRQNTQSAFQRFASLAPNSLFISEPCFVGYGNSFDGKLFLFDMLRQKGIKISLCIAYYEDFKWFVINWLYDSKPKEIADKKERLRECLSFHDIYYANPVNIISAQGKCIDEFVKLTFDALKEYFIEKNDIVRIKDTGVTSKVLHAYIGNKKEFCSFLLDDGLKITDEQRRKANMPYKEYTIDQIEKLK